MTKATKNKDVSSGSVTLSVPPSPEKRKPIKSFILNNVSASVWARDHQVRGEARRFYSVTIERSYRDASGKYLYTRSFNPEDLGTLMSLCQQVGEYLLDVQGMQQATAED